MKRIVLSILIFSTFLWDGYSREDTDSIAFHKADWQITKLKKGAEAMYAQINMFNSVQSINVIKYSAEQFKTKIVHRPKNRAKKLSRMARNIGAKLAINAGYFHVKSLTPSVYFRIGEQTYAHTDSTEVFRVDGVVGIKDKHGKDLCIEFSDTSQYETITNDWYAAIASGPMLMVEDSIVVEKTNVEGSKNSSPFFYRRHPRAAIGEDSQGNIYYLVIDGRFPGQADGASIYETAYICKLLGMSTAINLDGGGSATLWSNTRGVLNHPSDNKTWNNKGERNVPNMIIAY